MLLSRGNLILLLRLELSCRRGFPAAMLMASTALSTPALAQAPSAPDQAQPGLSEIVVTATRQAQSLNKVPLSIVAKDQDELDQEGVRSMTDIARLTPSITFGQNSLYYGTGQSTISIRGIDSVSGIPTTGVYIDDTPIQTRLGVSPSLTNAYPQVFDLDRVEVLRGPQGTLFGSGSVGGAVRFIMPEPSLTESSYYGRTEVADTRNGAPSYELGLAGGTPILDNRIGFRGSLWYRDDGGYVDRLDPITNQVTQKNINDQQSYSGRLAVKVQATDALTITPSLFVQHTNIADGSRFSVDSSDPSKEQFNLNLNLIPEFHRETFYLPAVKATWDLGSMSLYYGGSYFTRQTSSQTDDTTLNLSLFAGYSGAFLPQFRNWFSGTLSHTSQWADTQELRLQNNNPDDRFNWVAGVFYQVSRVRDAFEAADPHMLDQMNFGQGLAGLAPFASVAEQYGTDLYGGQYSTVQRNINDDDQKAIFGQADYQVLPGLKLTLGLRYTDAVYTFNGFVAGPLYATTGETTTLTATNYTLTPKYGISYQINDQDMLYASAAKGVRGAGVAPAVGQSCTTDAAAVGFDPLTPHAVNPDQIWSYEAGTKDRFLDNKLALDMSAYHVDWKNVQTLFALPTCQLYTTLNLGNAAINGVDFSLALRPLEGLKLGMSVSAEHAAYTTNVFGPDNTIIRVKGESLPVAPISAQLNAEYDYFLGDYDLYSRADYTYTSHDGHPLDVASPLVDPNIPRAPFTSMLDLRAGARHDAMDISLFANNVTNSHPFLSLYHDSLTSNWYRAGTFRPLTIGVTVSIHG